MPLFQRVFVKKDKSTNNLQAPSAASSVGRTPSNSSQQSSDYVLPDINTPPDANGDYSRSHSPSPSKQLGAYAYSTSKSSGSSSSRSRLAMPGFKRKQTAPEKLAAQSTSPRASWSEPLDSPPSRTSMFSSYGRTSSSQSLPGSSSRQLEPPPQLPPIRLRDNSPARRSPAHQTLPVPKTPEMRTSNTVKIFNRGSKPTKLTKAPQLDTNIPSTSADPLDSFNLRSFRPVRPASPSNALDLNLPAPFLDQPYHQSPHHSPSSLVPPSPIGTRPRGSSQASDSSPRMTVAQFRQAQAESAKNRSSVHLPVPEHPSDGMPPGNVPLHLARPVSPNIALASGARTEGAASGNESGGEGSFTRPARLGPPVGRSSPIPRERTPVASSPIQRPASRAQTPNGSRLSAKWMLSDTSESDSSSGAGSNEDTERQRVGRPLRKPPLIADLNKMKGRSSPQPTARSGQFPSSFASSTSLRAGLSGAQSELVHGSTTTLTHPSQTVAALPPPLKAPSPHSNRNSPSPAPSPITNIRPGQYSAPRGSMDTEESVDVWSNTHSVVHSTMGSQEQLRGGARSELGHASSPNSRAGPRRVPAGTSTPSSRTPSRSLSANVYVPTPSSFSGRSNARKATLPPPETDTEDESKHVTSDDDAPLAALVPPKRPGSALSSHYSGSPMGSATNLPLRTASPARTETGSPARSAQTGSSVIPRASDNVATISQKSSTIARSRANSSATMLPNKYESDMPEPTSPTSTRGRRSTADLFTSSPSSTPTDPPGVTPSSKAKSTTHEDGFKTSLPPARSILKSGSSQTSSATSMIPQPREAKGAASTVSRPAPTVIQRNQSTFNRPLLREESPRSSVANSGLGLPTTPQTGSDAGLSVGNSVVSSSSGSSSVPMRTNAANRRSISFEDDPVYQPPAKSVHRREASDSSVGGTRARANTMDEQRNERRRTEAKAAIELGKVVNGPAPIDPDQVNQDQASFFPNQMQNWSQWQQMQQMHQQQQQQQMQAMSMGFGSGTPQPGTPFGMTPGMNPMMMGNNMMNMPQMFNPMMQQGMGFSMPSVPPMPPMMMGMDPSTMAAHQQALVYAKQAYQFAVAQQAMAVAGDEWERASNMGGFSGSPTRPPTMLGMGGGSVYGGSTLGITPPFGMSLGLGMGMGSGGSVWGGSVYGETFGPAQYPQRPNMNGGGGLAFPTSGSGEVEHGDRPQPRQRTMTAPSSSAPPAHLRGAGAPPLPPPSSWRPN